jgi:Tol biopolymer transport system component
MRAPRFPTALLAATILLLIGADGAPAQEEARLLRFPHIHGNTVVFTYAGDLYTAPLAGGEAKRLTSHEGLELFARFSPDGRWIAFSGEYAGTRQVYVMPSAGGEPRQLTFYPDVGPMPPRGGYDHLVLDWTPDGSKILIRANRTPFGQRVGRYYLVDPVNGGLEVPLEIPEGASGATFDASGTRLAYNIKSREWRHWKRYRAGRQQDVWIYDLANQASERITTESSTDNFPLWVGDEIYFVSDRDQEEKLNLWVYDPGTGTQSQVTRFTEHDVMWPSRGVGGIVFENGGYLYHLNPETREARKLTITLTGDFPHRARYFKNVAENVESFDISPSGKRVVFAARGELFTVPAENGNIRNISGTPADLLLLRRRGQLRPLRGAFGPFRRACPPRHRGGGLDGRGPLVSGLGVDRVVRQPEPAPGHGGGLQATGGDRRGGNRAPERPLLVRGREVDRLHQERRQRHVVRLALFLRFGGAGPGDGRDDRRGQPGLRPPGPFPLLRLGPGLQLLFRRGERLPQPHLRRDTPVRLRASVPGPQRRGAGGGGRGGSRGRGR